MGAQAALGGGAGLQGEHALLVTRVAAQAKLGLQETEMDDAREAMLSFDETTRATRSRFSTEVDRVIDDTRVRREAQLVREIERVNGQLGEALSRMSPGQLVHMTEGLAERAVAATTRSALAEVKTQRMLMEQRRLGHGACQQPIRIIMRRRRPQQASSRKPGCG